MTNEQRKILVVEDNELNSKLFHDILGAMDIEAVVVDHPNEVMKSLELFNPELILMDINLPQKSGKELIVEIKAMEQYKEVPIIAVTAMAMEDDKQSILETGCEGYISKPIDVMQFMEEIKKHLNTA